jgi:hypothetical protein
MYSIHYFIAQFILPKKIYRKHKYYFDELFSWFYMNNWSIGPEFSRNQSASYLVIFSFIFILRCLNFSIVYFIFVLIVL